MGLSTLAVTDPVLTAFAEEIGPEGPVAVEGGRTRWQLGGELAPGTRLMHAPEGVVEYAPAEMTVRVRAGTTVADLHAELAVAGQRTGLPERGGTVGGAVAVGENSIHVLGRSSVRNAVLQIRYVAADGRLVTGGGPTVKNVTGFNLPKLMVGSLGTLGWIAEVILRTNPIPETTRWLVSADADPFAARDAVLRPSAVLWDGRRTWVELEGHRAEVDHEQAALEQLATFEASSGPPPLPPRRWSLTPAQLRSLGDHDTGAFVASIGVGLVHASRPQPPRPVDPGAAEIARRMKELFDPTGRCNPGRQPGGG